MDEKKNMRGIRAAKWGGVVAVIGALLVVLSGYGYQWGWWGIGTGFRIFIPLGTALGILGGVSALVGLLRMKQPSGLNRALAVTGIVLGAAVLVNFSYWYQESQKGYPPIHDISTDLENPPEFVAIAPLREDAPNPVEYAGEETAEQQREHYPDLEPLYLDIPYDEAFDRALEAAESTSWEIMESDPEEGRIEAVHKLAWYGFIDDVVIRVDSAGTSRSRIDMRSKSRLGRGDLGVNAKRIRGYFRKFDQ